MNLTEDSTVSAMGAFQNGQTEPLERLRLCQWYVHLGANLWAAISTTNFHMTLNGGLERMTWNSEGGWACTRSRVHGKWARKNWPGAGWAGNSIWGQASSSQFIQDWWILTIRTLNTESFDTGPSPHTGSCNFLQMGVGSLFFFNDLFSQ